MLFDIKITFKDSGTGTDEIYWNAFSCVCFFLFQNNMEALAFKPPHGYYTDCSISDVMCILFLLFTSFCSHAQFDNQLLLVIYVLWFMLESRDE